MTQLFIRLIQPKSGLMATGLIFATLIPFANAQASSFVDVSLADNRSSFTATFSWDGTNDASELLFGISRSDFAQTCPFNNGICWDFSVFFSDNEVNGYDFFVSAQHVVPADDTDNDNGTLLNRRLSGIQSFPGGGFTGLPVTGNMSQQLLLKSEEHLPEHTDLYALLYSYPTENDDITFTLTGVHIPDDIPPVPESSSILSLLGLGLLGVASATRKKLKATTCKCDRL